MSRLLGGRLIACSACSRHVYVARKLARDVRDDSTGSGQWANDREQDAWLAPAGGTRGRN